MHRIQLQLHTDHHHLQLLLDCLSLEIDCYDFDSKRPADLSIMLSAIEYINEYADKWHHPTEDIIFDRLLEKDIPESKLIKQLKNEHKDIIIETDKINQIFEMVAEDCIIPADKLISGVRHFISLQRTHIEKENEFVYPLMEKLFTKKEWKEIAVDVKIQNDPLFSKPSKKEYEQLYRYIMNLKNEKQTETITTPKENY